MGKDGGRPEGRRSQDLRLRVGLVDPAADLLRSFWKKIM